MAKDAGQERPRRLLLYLGVREGAKGKLHHGYFGVGDDWQEREFPADPLPALSGNLHLYGKRFGFVRPGTVIRIECDAEDKTTVYGDSAEVVGHIDDETAAAWRAASDAVKTAHDLKKKAKKDAGRDLALEALEPLREAYRGLRDRNQRTALLARVMAYITG
jgi:hypothetical protein